MPRKAREESGTGIFHVMMRGINHQTIFEAPEDYYQFIATLDRMRFRNGRGTGSWHEKSTSTLFQLIA